MSCSPSSSARCKSEQNSADPERQVGFVLAKVRVILGHYCVRDSEPRGAGPAASEAVWTAERTNVFNKLYLQTDSRLFPRRRRGRTRTPRGTRCRSVARSHLIPVYRPPDLTMKRNSRRRAASPFPSITKILSVVVECLCGPAGPSIDRRTSTPSTRHPSHV